VDRLGDRQVVASPVFPQVKVSASYRDSFAERGEAIENPRIKGNFNRAVAKRIELLEENLHEIFVSSPEGQRAIAQEAAKVFIRDGQLAKTTATRALVEASKIHQQAAALATEVLGSLQNREYIDSSIVRETLVSKTRRQVRSRGTTTFVGTSCVSPLDLLTRRCRSRTSAAKKTTRCYKPLIAFLPNTGLEPSVCTAGRSSCLGGVGFPAH